MTDQTETPSDHDRLMAVAQQFEDHARTLDATLERARWQDQARLLRHVAAEAAQAEHGRTASSAFWAEAGESILAAMQAETHASTTRGQRALDGARVTL